MTADRALRLEADLDTGRIADGDIRYVVMRADVVMGIEARLPPEARPAFLEAMEESAFAHARGSFEAYRARGAATLADMLTAASTASARLGWGRWTFAPPAGGELRLSVLHSPFAAGYGSSAVAVCAPIRGVLRAMLAAGGYPSARVRELGCVAQGQAECTFHAVLQP